MAPLAATPEPVWVGARLRPLSPAERRRKEATAWQAVNGKTLRLLDTLEKLGLYGGSSFSYDGVFGPTSSSEEVYSAAARDRVTSAMQGLNATIFVYGQTGSGKTYTMKQIVALAAADIFKAIESTPDREFLLKLTAFEIYNERVRDLLVEGSERQNLPLLDDPERGTVADGVTEAGLENAEQLTRLVRAVEARRTVRDTRMNAESSRSHQILRIYIESRPATVDPDQTVSESGEDLRPVKVSTINFVDLAGSERGTMVPTENGNMERMRQTEGSAINKSLLTLGNVIRALGEGKARGHVPFRDSKLTRMLQPALGGNSRTAIICTLSPVAGAVEMSRAALHFANAAKRVTMQPVVNEVVNERARLRTLQSEIDSLRRQLAERDFAEEAAQLSAALRVKEQEARLTAEERDHIQKRLKNLERLILRAEPAKDMRRASWAEMPRGISPLPKGIRQGPLHMSWNSLAHSPALSGTPPQQSNSTGHSNARFQSVSTTSDRLLLDCLIPPSVRQRATPRYGETSSKSSGSSDGRAAASPSGQEAESKLQRIEELQGPMGDDEKAALVALQAEVRCMSHTPDARGSPANTMTFLQDELSRLQDDCERGTAASEAQEETIAALRAEVARLESAQLTQQAADSALDSLQDKITELKLSVDSQQRAEGLEVINHLPSWFSPGAYTEPPVVLDAESAAFAHGVRMASLTPYADEDDDSPLMSSPSGSPVRPSSGVRRQPSPRVPLQENYAHVGSLAQDTSPPYASMAASCVGQPPQKPSPEANAQWYIAELRRMKKAFKDAAAKDVEELRTALEQQREQAARLQCQKQLLLKQVLHLEARVEDVESINRDLKAQLAAEKQRADRAEAAEEAATEAAKKAVLEKPVLERRVSEGSSTATESPEAFRAARRRANLIGTEQDPAQLPMPALTPGWQGPPSKVPMLKLQGEVPSHMLDDNDSWAAPPSVENLLPKIVELWEELKVPLVHRSRFYLAFRGRELFYYEAEKRRLAWLKSEVGSTEEGSPQSRQKAKSALARANRKLEWERKWLAQQVKWDFSSEQREEMFLEWNIHRDSKQRKMQLVKRLWTPETLRKSGGMQRSAELVMRLNGSDATEGMYDLVFGRQQDEGVVRTMLATGGSMLAKFKTPLRASSMSSAMGNSPAATPTRPPVATRRKSFLSGLVAQLTPRGRNAADSAGVAPLRAGSMAWTPLSSPRT